MFTYYAAPLFTIIFYLIVHLPRDAALPTYLGR